jgi:hypothetical protein
MSTLDITVFRGMYPVFADETAYPDATLESYYEMGKCYIKDNDCTLPEACREQALMLMLAHLLYIKSLADQGNKAVVVTSATEGQVSVGIAQPPSSDNFSYWLNTSPYGPKILAMLEIASAGGFYVGGSMERQGFRKAGGGF